MCPGTEVHGLRRAGGINLDYLRVVFPRKRVDRLYAVLLEYNNDVNAAAAKLQQGIITLLCVCVCVRACLKEQYTNNATVDAHLNRTKQRVSQPNIRPTRRPEEKQSGFI